MHKQDLLVLKILWGQKNPDLHIWDCNSERWDTGLELKVDVNTRPGFEKIFNQTVD